MKIVKKVSLILGALLCTLSLQAYAEAPAFKVAVVNVQQLLQQSPRVTKLTKKLENDFKNRQAKMGDDQKALQDDMENFKKESPTMTQKQRDEKQKSISAKRAELVKQVVAYQQDLQKEQNKIMQNILGNLNTIVANIAKNQNYSLVLDSQAVIYSADGTKSDITKDVASQFNSQE